jgi:hypothetical protein
MTPSLNPARKPKRPDLIPDHALVPGEEDLFHHGDYVDRLMAIINTASAEHTSVNVALYGSWGSGKSGTSNLLKHRLEAELRKGQWHGHVAVFNALTYARRPLLRQFIVHLAEQLLDKERAKSYRREVYEQTARPRVEFPGLTLGKVRRPAALVASGIMAMALVIALLLFLLKGDAREAIRDTLLGVFPALVPTAIFVGIVGWALRFLTVTTTRAAPESDEEFERLFVKLLRKDLAVDRHGQRRLVVFIDELDRCSPKEVVATLESLRTFLGVPGCVFIVAADQQALEHALTEELRQATPADPSNPYYSAGNAYLDKIFQYQLSFPPLRPRRLTHYALQLIEGRGGAWDEIDIEDVVSVLLPVHVHSPRRVKVLLNSFALAYATAMARAGRGQLDREIASRAPELAKLVCLRTEFPLFARDLESSDRLPSLVLQARELMEKDLDPWQDSLLKSHPRDLAERAILYASGKLPVAELLGERKAQPVAERTEEDSGIEQDDLEDVEREGVVSTVQVAYALQLVSYLEKTADIPGPREDLVHLEGGGAVWELDPQVAQQLQNDALGNRSEEVVKTVGAMEDESDRANALRLLGALTRESVGTDADNAARGLLLALAEAHVPLDSVAPALTSDVDHYRRRRGLRAEDLPGAFSLALAAGHDDLLRELLDREEAVDEQGYRVALIRATPQLWPEHGRRLAEVCAAEIVHDSAGVAETLATFPEDLAAGLLRASTSRVTKNVAKDLSLAHKQDTDPETREQIERHVDRQLAEIAGLARALVDWRRKRLAELALLTLVASSRGSRLEREVLAELRPLETQEATLAVLEDLPRWEAPEVEAELLQALDPMVVSQVSSAQDKLDSYGEHLWAVLRGAEKEAPQALWRELARVSERIETPQGRTAEVVCTRLARRVDSQAAAAELDRDFELAQQLVTAHLLDSGSIAGGMLRAVTASVSPPPPALDVDQVLEHLQRWCQTTAPRAAPEELAVAEEAFVSEDCWVPTPQRETMSVFLAAQLARTGGRVQKIAPEQVQTLARDHGSAFAPGAAAWLEQFAASPGEAFNAIEPYISKTLPVTLREALGRYVDRLSPAERAELCKPAVEDAFALRPSSDFFRAAHLAGADEDTIAESLVRLFGKADNLTDREQVLIIWELLDPKSADVRRHLIREVFLPLADSGATAFDLARRHLKLCADPPRGTKQQILDSLAAAAPDRKRAEQMRKRMLEVGLIEEKKQKGWLRRAIGL